MDGNKMKFKTRTQKIFIFPRTIHANEIIVFKLKSMSVNNVVETRSAAEATPIQGCR
jgi:hypothetical protein